MIRNVRRIPLQARTTHLRVERDEREHGWRVWISHDLTCTFGTYILLEDDGTISRICVHNDGTQDEFAVVEAGDGTKSGR